MEGDHHVGRIFDTLKEIGVDENTVIFASDTDFYRGEMVAVRWKQRRMYFTDVRPTGIGPQRQPGEANVTLLMSGFGNCG